MLAIPREIPSEQHADLIRDYCREFFVSKGMIADFAIHDKGDGPPRPYLLTMRAIDEKGKWLPKSRKVYDLDENGERIRLPSGKRKSHKENTVDWNDWKYAEIWRQGWEVTAVYQDDGFTGLNMERPDLKRMLKAIERKQINLVITKDLSRLGRNYLQTGHCALQKYPERDVQQGYFQESPFFLCAEGAESPVHRLPCPVWLPKRPGGQEPPAGGRGNRPGCPADFRVCAGRARPQLHPAQAGGRKALLPHMVEPEAGTSEHPHQINTCEAQQKGQREAMERTLAKDGERIDVLDKMVLRLYEDMVAGRITEENLNLLLEKTQKEQFLRLSLRVFYMNSIKHIRS